MTGKVISTPYDTITDKIIGCAMAVHRELGPGLREDSYQRALAHKLADAEFAFEQQKLYEVYEDPEQKRLVGYYIPDFVVEGAIVVEIKALKGTDHRLPGGVWLLAWLADQFWRTKPALPPRFPAPKSDR